MIGLKCLQVLSEDKSRFENSVTFADCGIEWSSDRTATRNCSRVG